MQRFGITLGIALCSVLANGCWKGVAVPVAAAVLSVKGKVVFGSGERSRFEPVTTKSLIRRGDTVRSMEGASLDLMFIPGALAQLAGDSEITIEELTVVKDGNESGDGMRNRSARIRLQRGKMIILFARSDTSPSRLVISAGELAVNLDSDSLLAVWTDGTKARVTTAKEKVVASAGPQPAITVGGGYFLLSGVSPSKAVAAADDAAAQIDVTESVRAEQRLREEWSAWQSRRLF
jgi:hypothetical protein